MDKRPCDTGGHSEFLIPSRLLSSVMNHLAHNWLHRYSLLVVTALLCIQPICPTLADDGQPLHQRIDQLINAAYTGPVSAPADDAEFLRRITLDLAGRIPTAAETEAFLNGKTESATKRTQLIDKLLANPWHVRHMVYVFNNIFMERRKSSMIPETEWLAYLHKSFSANKPWDQLAREILNADGTESPTRPAAKFYLDREKFNVDLITQDVGRVFLGRDLECAQCHDHPSVDDYLQRHYYGIAAFLKRSYPIQDKKSKKWMIGEKAEGDVKFTSVFTQESAKTNPRLLDLQEIQDPKGTEKAYVVKPAKNVRSVPKYSRRNQLGTIMTSPHNLAFRHNIVNRLWAMMMGRGLVEPLDMLSAGNPATHPELLDLLAEEFLKHNYDIRWLLRELALSGTYQSSSQLPENYNAAAAKHKYATSTLKPLTPEQLAWSLMIATGAAEQQLAPLVKKKLKADPKQGPQIVQDPKWREETLHSIKTLKTYVTIFSNTFGSSGGQQTRFQSSADQALFLKNGNVLAGWIISGPEKLSFKLSKLKDDTDLATQLYLATLNRKPTEAETQDIINYLTDESKRSNAIEELIWSILTSAEFRFNH